MQERKREEAMSYDPVARDIWLTTEPEKPYLCDLCGAEVDEDEEYQGTWICEDCLEKHSESTESE